MSTLGSALTSIFSGASSFLGNLVSMIASILSGASSLIEIVKTALSLSTVIIIVWLVLFFVGNFKNTVTRWIGSDQISAVSETDQLITSIAQIDLLQIRKGGSWNYDIEDSIKDAEGFCLHTYSIAFGYDSVSGVTNMYKNNKILPGPSIIAINAIRAEATPSEFTKSCDSFNLASRRPELTRIITTVLQNQDKVLNEHLRQGKFALASFIDLDRAECFVKNSVEQSCALITLISELNSEKNKLAENLKKNNKTIVDSNEKIKEILPAVVKKIANDNNLISKETGDDDLDDDDFYDDDFNSLIFNSVERAYPKQEVFNNAYSIKDFTDSELKIGDARNITMTKKLFSGHSQLISARNNSIFEEREINSINRVLADIQSGMASLTVTISMIAGVSQDTSYIWGLIEFNDFLIKRDVAKIIYGTYVSALPFLIENDSLWSFASEEKVVELPLPTILAIDRWTALLAEKGDIANDEHTEMTMLSRLNTQVISLLDNAIKRIDSHAVNASKAIITNRLLLRYPNNNLRIKFENNSNKNLDMFRFESFRKYSLYGQN